MLYNRHAIRYINEVTETSKLREELIADGMSMNIKSPRSRKIPGASLSISRFYDLEQAANPIHQIVSAEESDHNQRNNGHDLNQNIQ